MNFTTTIYKKYSDETVEVAGRYNGLRWIYITIEDNNQLKDIVGYSPDRLDISTFERPVFELDAVKDPLMGALFTNNYQLTDITEYEIVFNDGTVVKDPIINLKQDGITEFYLNDDGTIDVRLTRHEPHFTRTEFFANAKNRLADLKTLFAETGNQEVGDYTVLLEKFITDWENDEDFNYAMYPYPAETFSI
jgi:hypothetical protein